MMNINGNKVKKLAGPTRAKRIVRPFELLAWRKVLALCSYTFEVVGVELEAVAEHVRLA